MRYSTGAIVLHWLIAILIALNFAVAWVAEDMPKAEAMQMMGNHKAIGITILVLSLARIGWRLTHPAPAFAPTVKPWEALLARITHGLLYVLMIAIPLAGWATHSASTGGKPVSAFGLFAWPGLPMALDKAATETFGELHEVLAMALLVLAGIHVLGALKHQFLNHDGNLGRMGIGRVKV